MRGKLTDEHVREIRELYASVRTPNGYRSNRKELAQQYGVTEKYVARIAGCRARTGVV